MAVPVHGGVRVTGNLRISGRLGVGTFEFDLDLDVAGGEVVGLLGPNGAGKSTVLRHVAGLLAMRTGSLTLAGACLDGDTRFVPAHRRPAGYVFQHYRLFPHLSVLDNIAFERAGRVGRRQARRQVRPWLETFDLTGLAHARPGRLSGGQAQRVALARALARDPGVLLLDEPMAALDARTRMQVREVLRDQLDAFPGPTLLVTHDPVEAMTLADRIVVLEHGAVLQSGPPVQVARRPASGYVARLMGLNLLTGVSLGSRKVALAGGAHAVGVTEDGEDPSPGRPAMAAVRPTALTVHTLPPEGSSSRNVWAGTVQALETLGDRVRLQVTGPPDLLVDVTAAAVAELGLGAGTQVWTTAKATDTLIYMDLRPQHVKDPAE